jgi:hypothetical protein
VAERTLGDVRNYLFLQAERLWRLSLALSVGTVVLAIAGLGSSDPFWIAVVGLAALLVPILIAWIREAANSYQLKGDKCRRLIFMADGLGKPISAAEVAEIRAWSIGAILTPASFLPPFYSSAYQPGPHRLADIASESSFFTEHLTRKLEAGLWSLFGVLILGAIAALFLAGLTNSSSMGWATASKSIAVFLAFLISGDLALLAKKYGELRREAHEVYRRCSELLKDPQLRADDVRNVVEAYSIALVQCPPIPNWLYLRYRDKLNTIYRESHAP